MADVPQVTITDGVPTAGTGTVETLSTVKALIGEVQASPTANTLLDRLKTLATVFGTTALDLGSGTGGSRTLRFFKDTAQWIGGAGAVTTSVQRVTQAAVATIGHGVKTVTTAGTDVVLAGSTTADYVTIQAQTDNTGIIAVGASGVDATVATGTGVALAPGESISIPVPGRDLTNIYIDSTVSGEGVRFTYLVN